MSIISKIKSGTRRVFGAVKEFPELVVASVVLILAAASSYKLVNHNIEEINSSTETMVLDNVREDLSWEGSDISPVAYMMVDSYLYDTKGVRVNLLDSNYDIEKSGGLSHRTSVYPNSLIKEIAVYKDGGFKDLDPRSQEYKDIVELRTSLADATLSKKLFSETENQSLIDFGNYVLDNYDSSPEKWGAKEYVSLLMLSGLSLAVSFGAGLGVEYIRESEF